MDLKLMIFLFHIFLIDETVMGTDTQSKTTGSCGSPGIPGMPGVPGNPGGIGSPGFPGTVGAKGEPGVPGNRGGSGAKGEPGAKGEQGVAGKYGRPGSPGSVGEKGEPGEGLKANWKQCVWKRADAKDTGLIQNCIFKKKYDNTSLRVFYAGNLYSHGSGSCNRWYFTFDGAECTKPATIDGVVYDQTGSQPHRHRHIEGYCNQVPKGQVRVGFWIEKCQGYSKGDGYTGWNSMSRIVIEEVPPPQA